MTGNEFREARYRMDLSQTELALLLGVDRFQISHWEARGDAPVSARLVTVIELAVQAVEQQIAAENAAAT